MGVSLVRRERPTSAKAGLLPLSVYFFGWIFLFSTVQAKGNSPQLGIISSKHGIGTYFTDVPNIESGSKLTTIMQDGTSLCCFVVVKKTKRNDSVTDELSGRPIYAYKIRSPAAAPRAFIAPALSGKPEIRRHRDEFIVVAPGDRNTTFGLRLNWCASAEGLHFYAYPSGQGKLLAHFYYYLGYDVEPTCVDS